MARLLLTSLLRFSLVAPFLACLSGCENDAVFVARGVRGADVMRVTVHLAAGGELCVAAKAKSWRLRPALHLWDVATGTEVAHAAGSRLLLRREARLCHTNRQAAPRSYFVIARAADGGGTIDLLRGDEVIARDARIGGAALQVAHGEGYRYLVAATPRAAARASLYAFDDAGRLVGIADGGGPTGLPRLAAGARARTLLVAAEAAPGTLSVYANDPHDRDRDGLGRELERALGTCDSAEDPACRASALASYYRAIRTGTRDTDRDGLPDADELLGVAGKPALDLPRWGADPRHKDVFVEVDRHERAAHDALSESDYVRVARLFAQGSARELRNPDGKPGVRLHFDAGFAPVFADNAALVGDFGGSNVVALRDYRKARSTDFHPSRHGYFRYALISRQGTGQARRDAFTINRDYHRVPVFAHELAHTLGLSHEGHPSWGKVNCKPGYLSIMNYVYQNREDVGFSRRAGFALSPTRVIESEGLGRFPAGQLRESPFELDVFAGERGAAVDWNRDGMISREPVRAGLLFATYKSCGASTAARTTLAREDVAPVTPALARLAGRLHALWLDASGRLLSASGEVSGPDAHGSCPRGDEDKQGCMSFSVAREVVGLSGVRHIAALPLDAARLQLAYVDASSRLHLAVLAAAGSGLVVDDDVTIDGAVTRDAPALAQMSLDRARFGSERALAVFFRAADGGGALMHALAETPRGPWLVRPVRDGEGRAITTAYAPSVLTLGTGELCGVFPSAERLLRFHCYEPDRDTWSELSERAFYGGLGPEVGGPVGLGYHRYRTADGAPIGGPLSHGRGALYLTFTEPAPGTSGPPDNPNLYVSEWLDAAHGAREQIHFRWRGTLDSQWTHLAPGTAVTLYEDVELSALKAVMTQSDAGVWRVEFLPLADGAFSASLESGSDFEVMERGICTGIRSDAVCGDRATGAY